MPGLRPAGAAPGGVRQILLNRRAALALAGPVAVAALLSGALAVRAGAAGPAPFLAPIRAGDRYADPAVLLPGQATERGDGYDGQFYFEIAEDPFLRSPATARSLDNSFRYRRLLYPLLAWALALGDRARVPFTLVLLNAVSLAGLVGICAVAARRAGRSPWAGLLPAAYAGCWVPVLLDTPEPLQLVLMAAGMVAASPLLLGLAGLAKETATVALLTEAAVAARERRWAAAGAAAVTAGLLVAWAVAVFLLLHGPRFSTLGAHQLDPPGAPFLELATRGPAFAVVEAPALAVCVLALARLLRARDRAAWAAAAYALVVLAAGSDTWSDPAAFLRVSAGAVVLTFLSWVTARDRAGLAVLVLGAAAGALTLPAVLPAI